MLSAEKGPPQASPGVVRGGGELEQQSQTPHLLVRNGSLKKKEKGKEVANKEPIPPFLGGGGKELGCAERARSHPPLGTSDSWRKNFPPGTRQALNSPRAPPETWPEPRWRYF